jgi:hypothetical protein
MNVFNGKLELLSANPVPGEPTQWDIYGYFTDALGVFYASNIEVGDIIYNDISMLNMGILRYKVIYINTMTNDSEVYCRIEWALPNDDLFNTISDPYCGFETIIGRPITGVMFFPSATLQNVSESFLQYAKNVENWLVARGYYNNRLNNAPYDGIIDGENKNFILLNKYIPNTLVVKFNGMTIQEGIDYHVVDETITMNIAPSVTDNLVFDINLL